VQILCVCKERSINEGSGDTLHLVEKERGVAWYWIGLDWIAHVVGGAMSRSIQQAGAILLKSIRKHCTQNKRHAPSKTGMKSWFRIVRCLSSTNRSRNTAAFALADVGCSRGLLVALHQRE
jgi:hypothetical protein